MASWLRNSLIGIALISCAIIGARVYLELNQPDVLTLGGPVEAAPLDLPEFGLNDLYGTPRTISEWDGQPLLINFWATWCAPCRREIPLLQTLHTEQPVTGIQVLGVAIDRQSDVEAFVGEFGVAYPNLVGQEDAMAVSGLFGLEGLGLPFTVLSATDRKILTVHIGEIQAAEVAEFVRVTKAYDAGALSLSAARAELARL